MGACRLLAVIQSLDFILRVLGSDGKSLSRGMKLSDLQWLKNCCLRVEEWIGRGLERSRDTRLEIPPGDYDM